MKIAPANDWWSLYPLLYTLFQVAPKLEIITSSLKLLVMNTFTLRSLVLSALISLLAACGGNTPADGSAVETPAAPATPTAAGDEETLSYPSLPIAQMQELFNQTDYIDFVFYYADFSMNQSNETSIKATLAHVSNEVPTVYPSCQPIGSIFYQSKGKELMQAELFYSDKCVYYIWLENGERKYANKMTPAGFQFYQQIFSQTGQ